MKIWFANLRIRTKMLVAVGSVLTGTAGPGVFAISKIGLVNEQSTVMTQDWIPAIERVAGLKVAAANLRVLSSTTFWPFRPTVPGKQSRGAWRRP